MAKTSDSEAAQAFAVLVNMSAGELEAWLETDESRSVGHDPLKLRERDSPWAD